MGAESYKRCNHIIFKNQKLETSKNNFLFSIVLIIMFR
jgi:hypothetical protein